MASQAPRPRRIYREPITITATLRENRVGKQDRSLSELADSIDPRTSEAVQFD
jgi:hypothetical protein